ncbi:MAG TPA: serine/threonine-protein kinase [Polyangiales bacterium]|nr:serine/threonine-protein kinase [Polyangiales bacterium]
MPLDTEGARALLQRRIGYFCLMSGGIVAGFQLVGRTTNAVTQGAITRIMGPNALNVQLCTLAIYTLVWLRTRAAGLRARELQLLDAFATVVPLLSLRFAVTDFSPALRPELIVLLAVAHTLMIRAVLVPSSARRTLLLGALLALPITLGTHWFYLERMQPGMPPLYMYTVGTGAWACASVAVSSIMSHTIFGLRAKVLAATQLGQYTLERKIGQGGMGVVYRARHALLRRPTAIKLLSPERAGARDYERFEREVQLTSELTHPNTVSIYDYGRTPDGTFYYAMEYLDGLDLQQLIERDGPQSAACTVRVLAQVCGALAEAHARGLIHRDIKPANVILCERGGHPGIAKVVDFGLVKRMDATTTLSSSQTASIVGTPLYLSPEAIVRPEAIDARSDLYAVGALGYFLLTGTPVFSADTVVEICGHHLHSTPELPSARLGALVPNDVEALIVKLLAKAPAERPESAAQVVAELAVLAERYPFSPADARRWWTRLLAARDTPAPPRDAGTPRGSSQTVAVDLRSRH